MDQLIHALWQLHQHANQLSKLYQIDSWPTVPGYECLGEGIATLAGIDKEEMLTWFENECTGPEALLLYIETNKQTQ